MAERNDPRSDKLRRTVRERGNRLPLNLLRLARATFGDMDDALSHQDCIEALPEYVDAEIAGERVAQKFPQVKRHLDSCDDCSEQYAELLELVLAERSGQIPVPATIPEPNLAFLRDRAHSFPEFVKQKALTIVKAIAPVQVPDLLGIVDAFFRQVDQLGGKFAFERSAMRAMGLGAGELTAPIATLAVTYSATRKLIASLSAEQVDTLAAQNVLGKRAEELALLAARELNVKSAMAKNIANEFAALIAADPQDLRDLIEREKQ